MASPTVDQLIATADPPPTGIVNPIHNADGADGAGYAGALVAGVRTYGWAAQTIARALGDDWLTGGWVDFSLRRPLFEGEQVEITVSERPASQDESTVSERPASQDESTVSERPASHDGAQPSCSVEVIGRGQGGERVVLDGIAGLGHAVWLSELDPPPVAAGQDPPAERPTYDLESIPIGEPLRPLQVHLRAEAATKLATEDLGIDDPRYLEADPPHIQPYFLAGRMAPLTRHNFTYGPTIHVRSQIQHQGEARADQDVTVGARIVKAYDRNEHWYQVLDGVVSGSSAGELARIRHHTIFRPRGTTMPNPIRS